MKDVKEFKELLHLDIPLIVVEVHYKGENVKDLPWSEEPFVIKPYCFYERKDGEIYAYYDPEGINWKIEKAGRYDTDIISKKVLTKWDKFKDVIKNEKSLNREDFINFTTNIKDFWIWLDCMWWAIEYHEKENNKDKLDQLMLLRKETEYFAPGFFAVVRNSLKKTYPNKGNLVDVIRLKEFISDKLPSDSTLKNRLKKFAYTDGTLFNSLDELKEKYKVSIKKVDINKSILKGSTAYPGKVEGTVRIIKNREEISKVNKGDVLVASTTTPDFLPAMKISGAIISEHGGVICHAAITSRELEIPCVVGVEAATKVLKDGNKVEVNADEGIVKILERNEK